MAWPLSQDYNEAIQDAQSSFSDTELKAGEAVLNALGMPMPRSGNFADVYEFNTPATKGKWAIKCFTRHVLGLRERYTEISAALLAAKLPFAVDFQYLVQGIRIKGDWFPILKMRWVEGLLLNELVRENLDKPPVLGQLGLIWARMAKRLRESEIAHADLQHGNVILVPGSKAGSLAVKLIDYDGMFVPALASKKSGEVGHPNYQHPQRLREGIYTGEVDRFPLLVVATALRALSVVGKELWTRYDNGDNLLFRESDLKDPGKSALFAELHKIDDPQVRMLTEELHKAAERDLVEVPKIDELMPESKATKPASPIVAGKPPVGPAPEEEVPVEAVPEEAPESAFADVDRVEPKPKPKPAKSGVPMWALAGGGIAAVALILVVAVVGIAAFVMTRGGGGNNVVQNKDDAKDKKKDVNLDNPKDKDKHRDKDGPIKIENPPADVKLARADLFGVWDHTGGGGNVAITLHPSGKFDEPKGQGTWSLDGVTLTLRWPNATAPGGVWIDTCTVSKDGKTYQGANQAGRPVNGKKIGPLPAPADIVAFAMKGKVDPEFIREIKNALRLQLSADGKYFVYSIPKIGAFAFSEGPGFAAETIATVNGATSIVEPLTSFPDGKSMVFTSDFKGVSKILVWDFETKQMKTSITTFKKVRTVVVSPDMKYLLTYLTEPVQNAEHWIVLFKIGTKKEVKRWQSDKPLDVFGFSPDGTKVFFGKAKDAKVAAYSVTDGEEAEFAFVPREPWHAFSPDFSRVVSSENPWSLKIAQVDNGQAISTVKPPNPKILLHGPALSPNNKLLLVGIDDMANRPDKNGRGALIDIQSGEVISVTEPFTNVPYRTQLASNGIAVLDGQNVKPRIYRFPTEAPVIPVANAEGFVPIFNGKDLTGLRTHLRVPGTWRVENGILIGTGGDSDYLYALHESYKDFHLRLEARISKGAICEVNFRNEWNAMKEKPGFGEFTGYRAIIASEDHRLGKVGSLHVWGDRTKPVSALATEGPVAADEWFTLEIIAIGNSLTTKINGKTTATYLEPEKRFLTGHIFFRHILNGGLVEFRKIEIKELPGGAGVDPIAAGAPPARPANVNGLALDQTINFAGKTPVRRLEMGKTFNIGQSWALGLEAFLVDANGPDRLLFMWGDDRPGRDAIFLRQKGDSFSAAVGDTAANVQHGLRPPIAPTMVGRWVPVVFSYNASTQETEIYLDGKLALRDKCPFVPKLDMPMPVWIGGGNAKFQRFNGKIRSVWLANIPTGEAPVIPVGFVPLFNGKDLAGWKQNAKQPGYWRVEDGHIVGTGQDAGDLYTPRDDYRDFTLRMEMRVNAGALNLVYVRAPGEPAPAQPRDGFAAHISTLQNDQNKTGALHLFKAPLNFQPVLKNEGMIAADKWFTLEFVVKGELVMVKVDGKFTAARSTNFQELQAGRIIFAGSVPATRIEIRKIEIKETGVPAPVANAGDFVPLFNGKDLTGWKSEAKHAGDWKADNGNIIGSAKGATALVTTRDDYKDFHLRLEARYQPGCECLVVTRAPANPTMIKSMVGHHVFIKDAMNALDKSTGSLQRTAASGSGTYAPLTQPKVSPTRPDEWFVLEMIANGDDITVKVNGVTTAQASGDKHGYVKSGLIALYLVPWSKGTIEFKKIEIKELNVAAAPPFVAAEGFVPLFNGKNFAGWKMDKDSAPWRSDKGVLSAGGAGILHTARDDFKDFHLRLEARVQDADADGGILFRQTPTSHGCEMLVNSKNAGVIVAKGKSFTQNNGKGIPLTVGDWAVIDILAEGDKLTAKINGKMIAIFSGGRDDFPAGWIGLKHSAKGSIEFRNIEIKESKGEAAPPVGAGEFVQLFDGKNLNDWNVHPGSGWQVVQGVLTGTGGLPGMLFSKRGDYTDFHLRVEARFAANSRSDSIGFRTPTDHLGYEVLINNPNNDVNTTGQLMIRSKDQTTQVGSQAFAVPAGEWCTIEAIAKGNHFVIKVNGKVVADHIDKDEKFKSGHITLRQYPKSAIEFRKIEVMEFKPAKEDKPPPPVVDADGFVPLFNGKDLTGWEKDPGNTATWRVVNDMITASGPGYGMLRTTRNDFKDFHVRAEMRIISEKGGGSGFLWRTSSNTDGYDSNMLGGKFLGGILVHGKKTRSLKPSNPATVVSRDFFTLEVIAQGNRIRVKVDGKETIDFKDAQAEFASGRLAFRLTQNVILECRKIEIKELKPGKIESPPPAKGGFVSLFNGADLTGWQPLAKDPGDWKVVDGILTGSGKKGAIATIRDDYKDFHLRVEARIAPGTDGKFAVRAVPDETLKQVFKWQYWNAIMRDMPNGGYKLGSLTSQGPNGVGFAAPTPKPDVAKSGDWFTMDVVANGHRVSVKVNGVDGVSWLDDKKQLPLRGQILLHLVNPSGTMEFRKIEIKELNVKKGAAAGPEEKKPPADVPVVTGNGFELLFDGKDMNAWKRSKQSAFWRIQNGILTGGGQGAYDLASVRDDYSDFHLRAEARINDDGLGGLYFRAQFDPADANPKRHGYFARINSNNKDLYKTGSLNAFYDGSVRNLFVKETLVPPGQWFALEIIAKGDRISAKVDGKETKSFADQQAFLKGRFILTSMPQSLMEFRKIEIKDLAAERVHHRKIVNKNSGKVIGVFGAATTDGGALVQWEFVNTPNSNQNWMVVPIDKDWCRLVNVASGTCLSIFGNDAKAGARLVIWKQVDDAMSQQWKIVPIEDKEAGWVKFVNRGSGKVIAVASAGKKNGNALEIADDTGAPEQHWKLEKLD